MKQNSYKGLSNEQLSEFAALANLTMREICVGKSLALKETPDHEDLVNYNNPVVTGPVDMHNHMLICTLLFTIRLAFFSNLRCLGCDSPVGNHRI